MKKKVVMSIAGFDPSSGAGLQADLKAFTALGLHGITVVTCITVQNTKQVRTVYGLPAELIEKQIDILYDDIEPLITKTGMLYNEKIAKCVSKKIREYNMKTVVDPVMVATSGDALSKGNFVDTIVDELIPYAYLITPNIYEAYELTKIKIKNINDIKNACKKIYESGAKNVLIKGGHLNTAQVHDVLFDGEKFHIFSLPRIKDKKAHGSGCTLSSLITGLLALDEEITDAVWKAKHILWNMIYSGYTPGSGSDVLNHSSNIVNNLPSSFLSGERFNVWLELKRWIEKLVLILPSEYIPEVGLNIGYALSNAKTREEICAIDGRIVKTKERLFQNGKVDFGVSKHIAAIILAAMSFDSDMRCSMNLRYSRDVIENCKKVGFTVGSFDRKDEPENVKSTMEWGTKETIKNFGTVPDVIYDLGAIGKEPMIRILGRNPEDVIKKVEKLLKMKK